MAKLIPDKSLAKQDLPRINPKKGHFVIANRNSGDLSILNATNGNVIGQVTLPTGDNGETGEPTYLSFLNRNGSGYGWSGS